MSERVDHTQWLKRGTSTFIPTDNAKTVPRLEAGVYNMKYADNIGFYLFKKDMKLDDLIELPWEESDEVIDSIHKFWERKDKFKEYGFVYKRGILMYGPPGSGKTSIINMICRELINKHDGVIFILQTAGDLNLYQSGIPEIFRTIEPDRPIITVIEDIDGLCQRDDNETTLINILDGIEQLDNVLYLATTNYMEKLSERITNRPNRFDRRVKIGFPTPPVREAYIRFKLKPEDLASVDISKWVDKTDGMTISHIGELVKSVIILGNGFDETIDMLNGLKKVPKSHEYDQRSQDRGQIGFKNQKTDLKEDDFDGFLIQPTR